MRAVSGPADSFHRMRHLLACLAPYRWLTGSTEHRIRMSGGAADALLSKFLRKKINPKRKALS